MRSLQSSMPSMRFTSPVQVITYSIFVLSSILTPVRADDGTLSISIALNTGFSDQRECGKGCLQNNWDNGVAAMDVSRKFSCASNACFCGTQISTQMASFMTSCWTYCCNWDSVTIPKDVSTALSIYDGYCATAYPQHALSATTTAAGQLSTSSPGASPVAPTSQSTSTTSSSPAITSGADHTTLSRGTIGGIAGGVVCSILLGIGIGLGLCFRLRRNKKENKIAGGHIQQPPEEHYEKAELAASTNQVSADHDFKSGVVGRTSGAAPVVLGHIPTGDEKMTAQVNSRIVNLAELEWNPYRAELDANKDGK